MLIFRAALDIVEKEGFDELLEDVRCRIKEIENLRRWRIVAEYSCVGQVVRYNYCFYHDTTNPDYTLLKYISRKQDRGKPCDFWLCSLLFLPFDVSGLWSFPLWFWRLFREQFSGSWRSPHISIYFPTYGHPLEVITELTLTKYTSYVYRSPTLLHAFWLVSICHEEATSWWFLWSVTFMPYLQKNFKANNKHL